MDFLYIEFFLFQNTCSSLISHCEQQLIRVQFRATKNEAVIFSASFLHFYRFIDSPLKYKNIRHSSLWRLCKSYILQIREPVCRHASFTRRWTAIVRLFGSGDYPRALPFFLFLLIRARALSFSLHSYIEQTHKPARKARHSTSYRSNFMQGS